MSTGRATTGWYLFMWGRFSCVLNARGREVTYDRFEPPPYPTTALRAYAETHNGVGGRLYGHSLTGEMVFWWESRDDCWFRTDSCVAYERAVCFYRALEYPDYRAYIAERVVRRYQQFSHWVRGTHELQQELYDSAMDGQERFAQAVHDDNGFVIRAVPIDLVACVDWLTETAEYQRFYQLLTVPN